MVAPLSPPSAPRPDDTFLWSRHLATQAALGSARKLAKQATPVLLFGEPGSGRGRLARYLHDCGSVPGSPFVELDCAGLESLHFPENARGGAVFLREIGELSPALQDGLATLLAAGGARLRVLASAGPDLAARCDRGQFARRLYDVFGDSCLRVPALRERTVDVPDLVARLVAERRSSLRIGEAVMGYLVDYDWPGNFPELVRVIDRLCVCSSGPVASADDLPPQIRWFPGAVENGAASRPPDALGEEFQLQLIADALRRTHRR